MLNLFFKLIGHLKFKNKVPRLKDLLFGIAIPLKYEKDERRSHEAQILDSSLKNMISEFSS